MNTKDGITLRGIVRMSLYDSNGRPKKMFQDNKIWRFFNKIFGLDIKIPFITGRYTFGGVFHNSITAAGIVIAAKRLGGVTANPVGYMALGTGTPAANALGSEITTGGGERVAVTPASHTIDATNDSIRSANTYTFTDDFAITEEGLFDADTAGNMIAAVTFPSVSVESGDQLVQTHDLQMAAAA
jgi:hypothetical protein